MSRRIRTTRQARRCRDQAKVARMLRTVPPIVWTGMGFGSDAARELDRTTMVMRLRTEAMYGHAAAPSAGVVRIVGTTITADRIAAGSMLPAPLYRLASDRLGDPVIDWDADS